MSQYFQVGNQTLWNPSNGVAKLFIHMAEVVGNVTETPIGIRDTGSDEYEIDPGPFAAFVNEVTRRYFGTSHPILRSLLEGFLATALVLADRAGLHISALSQTTNLELRDVSIGSEGIGKPGDPARLQELAARHARAMPH